MLCEVPAQVPGVLLEDLFAEPIPVAATVQRAGEDQLAECIATSGHVAPAPGSLLSLDHVADWTGATDIDLLELDDALEKLAREAPDQARVVELRFYGGLTYDEIAESLGVSVPTAKRRWKVARVRLFSMLVPEGAGAD